MSERREGGKKGGKSAVTDIGNANGLTEADGYTTERDCIYILVLQTLQH